MEQLGIIRASGFSGKLRIGFIGHEHDMGFMRRALNETGLDWELQHHGDDLLRYEYPTQQMLWNFCRENPDANVAYFHTKGVSRPGNWVVIMWRWAMNKAILANLGNAELLTEEFPVCGAFLRPNYPAPMWHFMGNFWMATARFVNALKAPLEFAALEMTKDRTVMRGYRMPAEYWIGSASSPDRARQLFPAEGVVWPHEHREWCKSVEMQRSITLPHLF